MSSKSLASDEECLDFVLVDICNVDQSTVTEIKKKCFSLIDLLNNLNTIGFLNNQLTIEEKTKIIQFGN